MSTISKQSKHLDCCFRLFDKNRDGFITKKEFRWMTTSALISHETIDCVFKRQKSSLMPKDKLSWMQVVWLEIDQVYDKNLIG